MTPKIPLSRCRKCPLYHGHCPLNDLDPCILAPDEDAQMRTQLGLLVTLIAGVVIAAIIIFAGCTPKPKPQPIVPKWSAIELLRRQRGELSPWEKLQLAIIWTESKGNPDAVGSNGDYGLYQMTEQYVREVNRVAGTDYAHEDAFDPEKAVEMFALLQGYYNPEKDTDKAVYFHNKSAAYKRKVTENLMLIERMEAARRAVAR